MAEKTEKTEKKTTTKTSTRAKASGKAPTATRAVKAPAKAAVAARPVAKRTVARKRTAPAAVTPGAVEQWLCGSDQYLADELFARSEPAVDRGAAEAELGGDRLHVDAPPAQIAVHRQSEHVVATGGGGAAASRNRRGHVRHSP